MPITHAIAHHLACSTDGTARLALRPDELAVDENSQHLLATLKQSFLSRLSREHGHFEAEGEAAPLTSALQAWQEQTQSFAAMSAAFMEQLARQAEEQSLELDADCLFFIEASASGRLFHLFIVRRSSALAISDALEITPSHAIDTGPSLFGIKVDLDEWQERRDYAYLSLLPPRGHPALAKTFSALCGFQRGFDKAEATLNFLAGVEDYARQLPAEQLDDYRHQVVDYCSQQEEQDSPVELQGLSQALEGIDPAQFEHHMRAHGLDQAQGLMVDRRSLRQYVKFSGRERDLAVSFSSRQLDQRIFYDSASDTLSIQGLPKALREQLRRHLGKD